MQNLKTNLRKRLEGAKRIAVLGIGSDLMGDDVAGVLIANGLADTIPEDGCVPCKVVIGGAAPEGVVGEIRKFNPSHVIMIDAANLAAPPGHAELIELERIGGVSFSTHRLPTRILADYLIKATSCQIIVIGIQPKDLFFSEAASDEIKEAAQRLVIAMSEAIESLGV
jgi:hydrogenase 3 maturation protease